MTKTPRNLALTVLNGLSHKPFLSSTLLDDIFQQNPQLNERDKAFFNHLVHGVLRWRLRLDWIIEQKSDFPLEKISSTVLNILRLALYQIYFLDRVPQSAAVDEAVQESKAHAPKHVVSFVNGILRRICREKNEIPFPDQKTDPVHYLSTFYAYPSWLVERYIEDWGMKFTEELLSAGNRIPGLTLRTNRLRIDRQGLMEFLEKEGIQAYPTSHTPEGIQVEGLRGKPDEIASFKQGLFQVQDEAAQITSHLLAPQPGEAILDLCAGLGGKTTHLAELTQDKALLLALDISHQRLVSLARTCERLGLQGITSTVADASESLSGLLHAEFDRILLDAPCSGWGVVSRHPDGKWSRNNRDIDRLSQIQGRMLDEAVPLLRSGGRLLYVTCTLLKEENEGVVNAALERHQDLLLLNLRDHAPEWCRDLVDEQGFFRTFPHIHNMDGFFAALFTKE
ncbi:MAG: 16S rRNA (cytosine(967)-C(5))-methyltransferase RsmB [Deltaproteobacteria bacterium]|nr:16S rRNA (cytosine(967)-C(5))-methyltransferase RsmB [Deltaproteobacteria bacterium]